MIVPSIDLMGGRAVQLVRGRELALDAGDPRPLAERFGRVGEIAVVDLDAALGQGSNEEIILELLQMAPCRVGGGIRDADRAIRWLDAGATKVVLGTAAREDVLRRLPRERVIAALDCEHGEVVTHGWRERSGARVEDRIGALRDLVGGFLVTFVENEGTMSGLDVRRADSLRQACGRARLTVAGGVREASEIGELDAIGVDAQIGMALYTGRFGVADALAACLRSDRADGLWPTVVVDELGSALGLAYSDAESLRAAIDEGAGVYRSRRRGLWRKGMQSGAVQRLRRVDLDCDRDALRFSVRQEGTGFCHDGTTTCWADAPGLTGLERRVRDAMEGALPGSYTTRLAQDPALLRSKLVEEAGELANARTREEVMHEAADVLYFTLTRLAVEGVGLSEVVHELSRRAMRVTRRGGDAKTEVR